MENDRPTEDHLESEFKWFKEHLLDLQQKHPKGGHVVVKDGQSFGVWETRHEALTNGLNEYGNVPFLVRSIHEEGAYEVQFSTKSTC
jgi:hypothetical protein